MKVRYKNKFEAPSYEFVLCDNIKPVLTLHFNCSEKVPPAKKNSKLTVVIGCSYYLWLHSN